MGLGFPAQKVTKLRYCTGVIVTLADANYAEYIFRANSINDPDYTGTGHQPLGHDQWSQFYNHYVVLGSTITATISHLSGAPQRAFAFGCYIDDEATSETEDWTALAESGRAAWQIVNPNPTNSSGMQAQKTVRGFYSAKKFFNVRDVKDNLIRLGAVMNANPNEDAYFRLFWGTVDQSDTDAAIDFNITVTVEYTVLFSEPKTLVGS